MYFVYHIPPAKTSCQFQSSPRSIAWPVSLCLPLALRCLSSVQAGTPEFIKEHINTTLKYIQMQLKILTGTNPANIIKERPHTHKKGG